MLISGSLGSAYLKMAAESSVESSESDRLLVRNQGKQQVNGKVQEGLAQEAANDLAEFQGYINIGMSAYGAVSSVQNAGSKISEAGQQIETTPRLTEAGNQARTEVQSGQNGDGVDRLMSTQLTETGTVGDRFNRDQVGLLMKGEFTEADLEKAGFTEGERGQLMRAKEDGLTMDEAVEFMWNNRLPPQQQQQNSFREHLQEALTKNIGATLNGTFSKGQENLKDAQGGFAEQTKKTGELKDQLISQGLEYEKTINEAITRFVKIGAGTSQNSSR